MSTDGTVESRTGFLASWASLAARSSTLVCCALPALLVAVGMGAALSSLVSEFPQVVWLSEHKEGLFAAVGLMLAGAGVLQWRIDQRLALPAPLCAECACGPTESQRGCTR